MAKRTIQHQAAKGQRLTLDEIAAWVQEAMRAGADGSAVPRAVVSITGKLQKLSIDVDAPMRPIDQPH